MNFLSLKNYLVTVLVMQNLRKVKMHHNREIASHMRKFLLTTIHMLMFK
jgi:hypothetical protein